MPISKASRLAAGLLLLAGLAPAPSQEPSPSGPETPHRSPIALALSADGRRLLSANQTADTVSLVDTEAGKVLDEVETGRKPSGVALSKDGRRGIVAHWYGGDVALLAIDSDRVRIAGRLPVGPEPRGVAFGPDGKTAYVAVGVANEVVRVDFDSQKVTGRLAVGREPRGLALTPDGSRLVVGNARGESMSVISTKDWTVERTIPMEGSNLRQVIASPDGLYGYVANMKNRRFATTRGNIDNGWVLGQRLTRVRLDGSEPFETLSLDPQGKAASDVHGVGLSSDGRLLAVSSGGTHEVFLFQAGPKPLPWRSGSSRDVMEAQLLKGDGRFRRVPVGGRPTEIVFSPDDRTLYVANYLEDSIQAIDVESAALRGSIPLGRPSTTSLARRGEELFHDASRSFNQWYSCNTCHSDGHTNGLDFDTLNDGWQDLSTAHRRSRKKVPTLRRVAETGPWTWHGWQKSLEEAVVESYTKSMQGPRPTEDEARAVVAYLKTLDFPPNPYRLADGSLSESARRGEAIFRSSKAACSSPATAAPCTRTAGFIRSVSRSAATSTRATTPLPSAASMTRTHTSTTAAPPTSAGSSPRITTPSPSSAPPSWMSSSWTI